MIEELSELLVAVGIRVFSSVGVGPAQLLLHRRECRRIPHRQRVGALDGFDDARRTVAAALAPEANPPVGGGDLVDVGAGGPGDHVDDRIEIGPGEDVDGLVAHRGAGRRKAQGGHDHSVRPPARPLAPHPCRTATSGGCSATAV